MKKTLFILFVFSHLIFYSQKKYSKEVGIKTDNDLYISTYKDKYYTNGFFFYFRKLLPTKKKLISKKIIEWQLGHLMYTPYRALVNNVLLHDRPFAAYLYGSYGVKNIFKNRIFNYSIKVGVIGKAALGENLQNLIHDIYGYGKVIGWKYQIKNAIGVNIHASYIKNLITNTSNHYDINWINNAKIGTIFTDFSTGFYSRFGLKSLQKINNTIAFNSHLNNNSTSFFNHTESFLYIKTLISYNIYDATLQGSFLNTRSPVTKELIPINFYLESGLKFTINNYNFGYSVLYNTNKSKGLRFKNDNIYGSLTFNYSF